jgi:hypothetical protein
MKRLIYLIILLFFWVSVAHSQGEFNNWYFGQQAAISFNGGAPAPLSGSVMAVSEGCASISDAGGNLLNKRCGRQPSFL